MAIWRAMNAPPCETRQDKCPAAFRVRPQRRVTYRLRAQESDRNLSRKVPSILRAHRQVGIK